MARAARGGFAFISWKVYQKDIIARNFVDKFGNKLVYQVWNSLVFSLLFGLFQANLKLDHEATTYPCKNEKDMERIFQESICDRKTNFYEVKGFLYEAEAVDRA